MNRKLRPVITSFLVVLGVPSLWLGYQQLQVRAQQRAKAAVIHNDEIRISQRFLSIQPVGGKVLMTPAPSLKGLSFNMDLYVLSEPGDGYWKTPKTAGMGFKFGYFDGAENYEYQITRVQPDGIVLSFLDGTPPPGAPLKRLHLGWK